MEQVPSVEDAIALAARAHRGQRYPSPGAEPYIFHPLRVMLSLGEPGDQIVAVLHDVVEDTDVELRHLLSAGYPPEIVAAVDALSHRAHESYDDYIERVAANEIACRVKLADLRENLETTFGCRPRRGTWSGSLGTNRPSRDSPTPPDEPPPVASWRVRDRWFGSPAVG